MNTCSLSNLYKLVWLISISFGKCCALLTNMQDVVASSSFHSILPIGTSIQVEEEEEEEERASRSADLFSRTTTSTTRGVKKKKKQQQQQQSSSIVHRGGRSNDGGGQADEEKDDTSAIYDQVRRPSLCLCD
jgi:hypothetical protein